MFFATAVLLFIAAEFVIGWWALPVIGLILGALGARRSGAALQVGGAALIAWAVLFGWVATHGDLRAFMLALALSMKLEPGILLTAVAALPVLLAGATASLGAGIRNLVRPEVTAASSQAAALGA